jgi:hypothetical protein
MGRRLKFCKGPFIGRDHALADEALLKQAFNAGQTNCKAAMGLPASA